MTVLKRTICKRQEDLKKVCFFDIEAESFGKGKGDETDFIAGAVLLPQYEEPFIFTQLDEMIKFMLSKPTFTFRCHNAEYDLKFIIPYLQHHTELYKYAQLIIQGQSGRVIGLTVKLNTRKNIYFKDTFPVLPASLKKLAEQFDTPHKKLELNLQETEFNPNDPAHIKYLMNDTRALRECYVAFAKVLWKTFGTSVKYTAGGNSLTAWKRYIQEGLEITNLQPEIEEFVRLCYHGGHTFLTTTKECTDLVYIDFNSMYPSVMRDGVPFSYNPQISNKYMPDRLSFMHCIATCSKQKTPHPFIIANDKNRTTPWGVFDCYITSREYETGLKYGYEFKVLETVNFEYLYYGFNEYVDLCEKLRHEYKGHVLEFVVKLMQNSLYGKFGTKREITEYYIGDFKSDISLQVVNPSDGSIVENMIQVKKYSTNNYILPHWSAWITANARIKLIDTIYAVGCDNVVYGDTDSLIIYRKPFEEAVEKGLIKISDKYGDFKIEHMVDTFQARAPKNYIMDTMHKSKGIPKLFADDIKHEENIRTGEHSEVEMIKFNSILTMLKHGTAQWEHSHRSYSDIRNSNKYVENGDEIEPITVYMDTSTIVKFFKL